MEKSFKFQEWPVYKAALEVCSKMTEIRTKGTKIGHQDLFDQLKRASSSIPLNIAEGYGRYSKKDRISFLRVARGSAFECIAGMDILRTVHGVDDQKYDEIYSQIFDISKMLTGMINNIKKNFKD